MHENFDDLYNDAWTLLSYLKVHLKKLKEGQSKAPGDSKHLHLLQFFHTEILSAAKVILNAEEDEEHKKQIQSDYAQCAFEANGLIVLLADEVEKTKNSNETFRLQTIRDIVYSTVERIDKKLSAIPVK